MDTRAMIDMYRKGMKAKDIAQHFGIHPATVWKHLKKNNIPLRGTGNYERKPEEKRRLRKMIKEIGYVPSKGTRFSPKTEFKKGNKPWNKGKDWVELRGKNHPSRNPKHRDKFLEIWSSAKPNHPKGKNHPMWKGGKTPLIMKIRNSKQYAEWRMKVFERDNFSCFICRDSRGGNLNAHHIELLSKIIHKNKISTFEEALNCKDIWDVSNGITLCEKCHPSANEISKISSILKEECYE